MTVSIRKDKRDADGISHVTVFNVQVKLCEVSKVYLYFIIQKVFKERDLILD